MKRIAVTGATGMIGVALVEECVRREIGCLALVRPRSPHLHRLPRSPFVEICEYDMAACAPIAQAQAQTPCDAFFHLAWTHTDKEGRCDPALQSANIPAALAAAALAKRLGCAKFVFVGSQAEYGRVSGKITPAQPACPETAYGTAKYAAGKMTALYCAQNHMDFCWGRIFSVYGKWDHPDTLVSTLLADLLAGKTPRMSAGEQLWDYLYATDAARALLSIGEAGKNGAVYNIAGGHAQPLRNYAHTILALTSPQGSIDFGAVAYAPQQVMRLEADISALTADAGFTPQFTFEEGIKETIQWMKGQSK